MIDVSLAPRQPQIASKLYCIMTDIEYAFIHKTQSLFLDEAPRPGETNPQETRLIPLWETTLVETGLYLSKAMRVLG